MANGQVPYVKEEGVATFVDVNAWKSFGINKSFGEIDPGSPNGPGIANFPEVKMPSEGSHNLNYKLSPHQLGQAKAGFGKSDSGAEVKSDVVNNV